VVVASSEQQQTGLLLLINRLSQKKQTLRRDNILPFAEIKLPFVARNYERLVQELVRGGLARGDAESFQMTPAGEARVNQVSSQYSLAAWFYNEYYQAAQNSPAHAEFCEHVYGMNLCQHGLADMAQIHLLMDELRIREGVTVLDFGCGDGRISEYISDQTQARVTGVDIADRAIELAQIRTQTKRQRLSYFWADMERGEGSFPAGKFDCICAIDSLFFMNSQKAVLRILLEHLSPGGKLGAFYLCPPDVDAERTPLAQACQELGVTFLVHDLTTKNTAHVRKKRQVLQELAPLFQAEGQMFLYKNRLADSEGLEHHHRYLYII